MSRVIALSSLLSVLSSVRGQQVGTNTAETHPALSVSKCTSSGCTTSQQSIVLDANWRWLHTTSGYTNCYTGQAWDTSLCPDGATCASNCALDGADYPGTYGISTSGNSLNLKFVTTGGTGTANVGSRTFLMAPGSQTQYQMFDLRNQEFTFDIDMSTLPCGLNGALYFSQMDADGGMAKYPTNKAGAKYGTGYCDSQCPKDIKFIAGKANVDGWTGSSTDQNAGSGNTGACCQEMDVWEANSMAEAYTPHPCKAEGLVACTGSACTSTCDQAGCDFNSWRMGNKTFLGPGLTIDTKSKFTVVTQFLTDDGTNTGNLNEIRRFYVQNGKVIPNSQSNIAGVTGNSVTDSFCAAQKTAFKDTNTFASMGGLKQMGSAFANGGMVLVMSIWDDHAVNMLWLDSDYPTTADASAPGVNRGPCSTSSGAPTDVEKNSPNASVSFSNIKWGPIGSTQSGTTGSGSGSTGGGNGASTTSAKPSTTSAKPTTSAAAPPTSSGAAHYAQCGGTGWSGATTCASPYKCTVVNSYYSQCL
ncbi:MAG: hypothetical protein Q9227_001465 [Pyrenula ochraceoflavens]